jgi:hypothetical protein
VLFELPVVMMNVEFIQYGRKQCGTDDKNNNNACARDMQIEHNIV